MTTPHIGAQDGENVLSEIHEREVRAFNAHVGEQEARAMAITAAASRDFGMTKLWEAVATLVNGVTLFGTLAGGTELIRWWF